MPAPSGTPASTQLPFQLPQPAPARRLCGGLVRGSGCAVSAAMRGRVPGSARRPAQTSWRCGAPWLLGRLFLMPACTPCGEPHAQYDCQQMQTCTWEPAHMHSSMSLQLKSKQTSRRVPPGLLTAKVTQPLRSRHEASIFDPTPRMKAFPRAPMRSDGVTLPGLHCSFTSRSSLVMPPTPIIMYDAMYMAAE